jgi:hypothetical protein
MGEKRDICFVATNRTTCEQVGEQLHHLLGECIRVDTWSLRETRPADLHKYDMVIAATQPVYQQIIDRIPKDIKFLTANRTLETKNLDELLALPSGTEVLMVSSFERTLFQSLLSKST